MGAAANAGRMLHEAVFADSRQNFLSVKSRTKYYMIKYLEPYIIEGVTGKANSKRPYQTNLFLFY